MGTVRSVLGSDPFADPLERNSLEERIERVARAQLAERQRSTPHAMPPSNRGVGSSRFLQRWVDLLQRRPRRRSGGAIGRSIAVIVLATLAVGSVVVGLRVGRASQLGSPSALFAAETPLVGFAEGSTAAVWQPGFGPVLAENADGRLALAQWDPTEIDAFRVALASHDAARVPRTVLAAIPSATSRVSGEIAAGGTLSASLQEHGISQQTVDLLAREVRPLFDFRYARPGDRFSLVRGAAGEVVEFRYAYSPIESVRLVREGDRYVASREEVRVIPRRVQIEGVISTTLYDAIVDAGESPQLAADFVDIFAWDVDFSHSVQPGDEFGILQERFYRQEIDGSEVPVRSGRILAARYAGAAGTHAAVWFETDSGHGSYHRPDGTSVHREFLVAPVKYGRISSIYTSARRHPILKVTRPHHGIDYAAPSGTPVWAVANGVVTHRGWAGGFGRLVKILHPNGYESYYAHLSRYRGGVRVGDRVTQKQIVGYVGQSGLATGPHVCFRIAKDGHYVNPAHLSTPAGPPVPPDRTAQFALRRDALLLELEGTPSRLATLQAL